MNPHTAEPYFVLKNNGKTIKLYQNNESISRFYDFFSDKMRGLYYTPR